MDKEVRDGGVTKRGRGEEGEEKECTQWETKRVRRQRKKREVSYESVWFSN